MTLRQYIDSTKRIKKDTFISIHNKDDKWIICDTSDSTKIIDYMDMEVLSNNKIGPIEIVCLDYADTMSIASRSAETERFKLAQSNNSKRKK